MGGSACGFWCRSIVTFGAILVLLAACGGEDQNGDEIVRTALPPGVGLEQMRAMASDQQIAMFEDGEIDFADLERATFNFISCVEAAGFELISSPVYDEQKLRFQYDLVPPDNNPEAGIKELTDCSAAELTFVGEAWEAQHQATQAETDAALEMLRQCLIDAGETDLANTISEDQIASLLGDAAVGQDLARCLTEVVAETGVRLD